MSSKPMTHHISVGTEVNKRQWPQFMAACFRDTDNAHTVLVLTSQKLRRYTVKNGSDDLEVIASSRMCGDARSAPNDAIVTSQQFVQRVLLHIFKVVRVYGSIPMDASE